MKGKPYTEQEHKFIVDNYSLDKIPMIADVLNRTELSVRQYYYRVRLNNMKYIVPRSWNKIDQKTNDKIISLFYKLKDNRQVTIANKTKVSVNTVKNVLDRHFEEKMKNKVEY